jgi:hypothetical protein
MQLSMPDLPLPTAVAGVQDSQVMFVTTFPASPEKKIEPGSVPVQLSVIITGNGACVAVLTADVPASPARLFTRTIRVALTVTVWRGSWTLTVFVSEW